MNWPHVLLPWLKCGEQETRLVAFLTVCCLSHHFYDEDESIFQIDKHESQALLTCLTKAIELPNLSVPLCSNMFRISALHLIMSLKLFMINLKIAFKPKKMFGIMATLLVNGGLPEIRMACDYISAMKELKEVDFKLFMEECELPVVEILEGLKEIEDTEVKLASERAILAIQNYSNENGNGKFVFMCAFPRTHTSSLVSLCFSCLNLITVKDWMFYLCWVWYTLNMWATGFGILCDCQQRYSW